MQAITPELISILGVAAALFLQLLRMQQATMQAIGELRKDTARGAAELRERMARLEGLFEGFTQKSSPGA